MIARPIAGPIALPPVADVTQPRGGRRVTYAGLASQTGSDTSGSINLPSTSTWAAGDCVLIIARNSANEALTVSASGATQLAEVALTSPTTMRSIARLYRIDTTGPTFSASTATFATGLFITGIVVRGASTIEASATQHSDANGTTPMFGAATSGGAGRLAVAATLIRGSSAPQGVEAGWERPRNYGSSLGDDSRIVIDTKSAGSGAVTYPAHWTGAIAFPWASHALVLAP